MQIFSVVLTIDIYNIYYVYGSDFASSNRECELVRTGRRKSGNSAKSSVFDNISQLASASAIFLTVFTIGCNMSMECTLQ